MKVNILLSHSIWEAFSKLATLLRILIKSPFNNGKNKLGRLRSNANDVLTVRRMRFAPHNVDAKEGIHVNANEVCPA